MENYNKSPKSSRVMGSKVLIFICSLLLFASCWEPDEESINQLVVKNNTKDTLVFSNILRHLCPSCIVAAEDAWVLFPDVSKYIATDITLQGFDLLDNYCGSDLDTAVIYKIVSDSLSGKKLYTLSGNYYFVSPLVRWGGPLREMEDNVHDFYNERSWTFSKNPNDRKKKKVIATFTITEDDLKENKKEGF